MSTMLCVAVLCQVHADPPQFPPKLVVYVDEYVEREKRFKEEFTIRWRDRIPQETWETYSKGDYASNRGFCDTQDRRVAYLRKYFEITFENRASREFSIRVNRGLSIPLPDDDAILKTTMPIRIVEYVHQSYYHDQLHLTAYERQCEVFALPGVSWPEAQLRFPSPPIPKSPLPGLEINQDLIEKLDNPQPDPLDQ
jgi:hypothetical protein